MELATGAMGTLLPKLGELLTEEYKLQKSVRDNIMFTDREMTRIEAALRKVAEVPHDQIDMLVRAWAEEAREVSYGIEDSIDRLMLSIERDSDPGRLKKAFALLKKGTRRHQIGAVTGDMKMQVQELSDRRARYRIDESLHYGSATVDPRVMSLYTDPTQLVGMREGTDKIFKMLMTDGATNHGKLKIISIVGFAGLGKTTLAKAVYDKLRPDFDCAAFVSVGRNPDLMKLFKDILYQIDREKYSEDSAALAAATANEMICIEEIRGLLRDKRYFIVVDDIWNTKFWEVIRWAFIDSDCNSGSRVITTSRSYDVAARAGVLYRVEPLSRDDSKRLFHMRLFGSEVQSTDGETAQLMHTLLENVVGFH